jgi:hypothetical protein
MCVPPLPCADCFFLYNFPPTQIKEGDVVHLINVAEPALTRSAIMSAHLGGTAASEIRCVARTNWRC